MSSNKKLFENTFIKKDELNDTPSYRNQQFIDYYENKKKSQFQKNLVNNLKNLDSDDLLNTNFYKNPNDSNSTTTNFINKSSIENQNSSANLQLQNQNKSKNNNNVLVNEEKDTSRTKRLRKTVYNIDSRDRNLNLYENANDFKISLDRDYLNVKEVKLVSTEFPNTDRVIKSDICTKSQNNRIVWINKEDQDLASAFPEYSVTLQCGNYTVSSLTDEMKDKMDKVKRSSAGNNKYHYFDISINLDTDIVEIYSLNLTSLEDNPITTTKDSNQINVYIQEPINTSNAKWEVGDKFYLLNVKGFVGGISPNLLNGFHTITKTTLDDGASGFGPININENNFVIDFDESSSGGSIGFASLTKQIYDSPSDLATQIQTKLNSATTNSTTYTVSFSSNKFTISGDQSFELLFSSGTNISTSVSSVLGFDSTDTGSSTSHISDYNITINSVEFEVRLPATFSDLAGGNSVRAGDILPFKFLFSQGTDFNNNDFRSNTVACVLGYPEEDSSVDLTGTNQLSTFASGISNVTVGNSTTIVTNKVHNLNVGDNVKITGLITIPSINKNTNKLFTIASVPTSTSFTITFTTSSVNSESFSTSNVYSNKITVDHTSHGLINNDLVAIYRSTSVGGIKSNIINGKYRKITVIDSNSYSFNTEDIFSTKEENSGGGSKIRISSYKNDSTDNKSNTLYGFNGLQDNTSNGTNLNKSISLDGENYVLLTSPQLGTFSTSGSVNSTKGDKVNNVFAKLLLTGAPGSVIFNSYITSPKTFDTVPLNRLNELELSIRKQDDIKYNFFGLDYSFGIEITEIIDEINDTSFSSRRGVREIVDRSETSKEQIQ